MKHKSGVSANNIAQNTIINAVGMVLPLGVGVLSIPFIIQGLGDELFGIAMPPAAVADYLKRIWDSNSSVSTVMGGNGGEKDGILGVTSNNPNMPMYNGLEHYLFRHNGVVYSWGEQFNDIAHAAREGAGGANWQVCRFIEVH